MDSPNEFLFSVDGTPVLTKSDIHTIGAKQKGGKTSLVGILIAAILCGQWNRVRCLLDGATVLYVDTEMKPIDTQELAHKVAKMAGMDVEAIKERLHMVNFRPLTPEEMETGIRYFVSKYKPTLVVIDGVVDLCSNFNDVEASQRLVLGFLIKIAEKFKCAIINVLHTNKTDGYTELRGHLGAFFEQKGSTVMRCEKDEANNLVTVKFSTHRYAPVSDFHFTFDDDGLPICADGIHQQKVEDELRAKEEQKDAKKQKVMQNRIKVVTDILSSNGGQMNRKDLIPLVMDSIGKGKTSADTLIRNMKEMPNPPIVENNGSSPI